MKTRIPFSQLAAACAVSGLLTASADAQLAPIGLSEVRGQFLVHDSAAAAGDNFGWSFASGDFNGDGAADLASGAPFDNGATGAGQVNSGAVFVRYGQPGRGLRTDVASVRIQEPAGQAQANDYFGSALAAGDFDGDGFDDLAVGIVGDEEPTRGAVRIYFGAASGLSPGGEQILREIDAGEPQHACSVSQFGWALAAANFDGDAFADLAVGVHGGCERIDDALVHSGSVFVAHGSAAGLVPFHGYRISQSAFGFDPSEAGDNFGDAVAAGDFDADGYDDLAIGIPGENGHGAIQIVMGSEFGLLFPDNATWYPGALGETPEPGDRLGYALACGDFDGDGHDDLAIGSPYESPDPDNDVVASGKIAVAYGGPPPSWFDLGRTDRLGQGDIHGANHEGQNDLFGHALAAGDFDGDGRSDLAVGHPFDDWSGEGHGNVTILMGDSAGIGASARHRLLGVGWEGIPGDGSQFLQDSGRALASGDFDGDGFADLAIGAPTCDAGGAVDAGTVTVLYGALFADGFETASTARW